MTKKDITKEQIELYKYCISVMEAFDQGIPIEIFSHIHNEWRPCGTPLWDWINYNYRIAVTKPSINWDHVGEEYKFLFKTCGICFVSTDRPTWSSSGWKGAGQTQYVAAFKSLSIGTCKSEDSLVERPT